MLNKLDKRFMMVRMGYSYRIGELEGALGVAQLENRECIMGTRKKNAEDLTKKLYHLQEYSQLPYFPDYIDHSFMMYPIVLRRDVSFVRRELTEYLEAKNIESGPMLPLLNQSVYREIFGDIEKQYPVAEWINNNGFYVGCHHGLTDENLDYIVAVITDFIDSKLK